MKNVGEGEIIIGGTLPAALLEEFLDTIDSSGLKVGKRDGADAAFQDAEQLRRVLNENGHLLLVADQERQFNELEEFCVQRGIAFDRRGDGGNVYFRQGLQRPESSDKGSDALLARKYPPARQGGGEARDRHFDKTEAAGRGNQGHTALEQSSTA